MTMSEMRRQYSELRSIARKRVQRLGTGEFSWTKTYRNAFYQFHTQFRPIASLGDISKSKMAELIKDLDAFVHNKEYSTRGLQQIRAKSLKTLHKKDEKTGKVAYPFVTRENWREWTEFLDWWRDQQPTKEGSPTRAEMRNYLDNISKGMSEEEAKREFENYVKKHIR